MPVDRLEDARAFLGAAGLAVEDLAPAVDGSDGRVRAGAQAPRAR